MGQSEKMEQEDNRPKWLLELENRKRKPRLAHEVGAGAPCMTCNTACPGLDLHFWRKICKNCKCSRDDHDVPNDEFPQFDLLFGPSGKPNRKTIVLKVNKKQNEAEVTFEWAPPDTTKELAADYMKALPEDKLPIKGSAGAALRKQQLQRQLPLHDIDHKVCDELSEFERKQFEKYLENLKKYVGQGKVMKAMGARPFDRSLMTPANATDMNRFSPKHKQNSPETIHSLNLRTPSSFVPKSSFSTLLNAAELSNGLANRRFDSPARDHSPSSAARMELLHSPALEKSINENTQQGRYHRALANVRNDSEITGSKPVGGMRNPPLNFARTNKINESAFTSLRGENESTTDRQLELSSNTKNPNISNSHRTGVINNPAVQFAASNMIGDNEHANNLLSPRSENPENDENRKLNYAMSNTLFDQELASPSDNLNIHSSGNSARSEEFNANLKTNEDEETKNRDNENSLFAEKMLNEALLPPSSINAADIIGSTLDEKGLSFIREQLISKYRAKEEPANIQNSERCRDFSGNERNESGARSKRADQLRRQGAFDKESDRSEIIAAMRTPSGIMSEEFSRANIDDNSSTENLKDAQNFATKMANNESNYQQNEVRPCDKETFGFSEFKDDSGNAPWMKIMQGICDNYLTKPGQEIEGNHGAINNHNKNSSSIINSNVVQTNPITSCQSLRAELSNYGPGNSNVIKSEDLNNPVFPEEAIVRSGIVQNPVNVDHLRGEIEELSVCQSKMENCHQCRESIRAGDVVVTAEKANDAFWHPGCFVCSVCNELLADLVYFYYKGKLYCGRDLATLLEIPRCFACDELIFVREYTVAEGHNYHVKHFCCWDCDVPLAGQQYISENDRPLCLPCYQGTYAKTCCTCDGVIAADQQGVAVKNLNFHANDQCFCCATCKKSLLNGKMAIKEDRPFCSKECITKFLNERTD